MSYTNYRPSGSSSQNQFTYGAEQANGDSRVRRFGFDPTPETSADERSRSRGPPHAGGPAHHDPHPSYGAPRQYGRRRDQDYDDDSVSRSRSRPAHVAAGRGGDQVEDLLRYIEQQWSFMASDSCVPVKVALQLMDASSLGLQDQYGNFQQVHQQLQNALKIIVNEHHQGFNSSIGTFHKIQSAIHAAQHRVRTLRAGLEQAKDSLGGGKPELRAFASSSQSYDSMLQTLRVIEHLKALPEILEAQISEKTFLGAVTTLQEALTLIRKPELNDIGALSDLKVYLSNQDHSLTDILIEELHSHLYLKSPYCEERWKAHMSHSDGTGLDSVQDTDRALHRFLHNLEGSNAVQEDPSRNPEADTFTYIHVLVESLNQLNRLDTAVEAIEDRMPVELFRVVERSYLEVDQRHPGRGRATVRDKADSQALPKELDAERRAILEDLLHTLYAKFEAIAEGHRALHDVTSAILKRPNDSYSGEGATKLNRSFRELWKLLQSEIRTLLHDHLATNASAAGSEGRQKDSSANIFKAQPRDRTRKIFKLSDTDARSTNLVTEREDLEFILRSSVPGLVNRHQDPSARDSKQLSSRLAGGTSGDSTALPDRSATGHKLLVKPSVFNMSILLPPSLRFLTRLREIVPPRSSVVANTLTSFLDDFLINVFYPQLEETLIDLCGRATNGPEAFQPEPGSTSKYSLRPIFRGTVRFFEALEHVCRMLDSLPHEQSFSSLVISQMRAYYDKCFSWSKSLLQRTMAAQNGGDGTKMRLAADLATSGDINDTVVERMTAGDDTQKIIVLAEKESALMVQLAKMRKLEEGDLINDPKSLTALATLQVSMKWLAARCQSLRLISPTAIDMGSLHHQARRWTERHSQQIQPVNSLSLLPDNRVYLPLDSTTATQFDAVVLSFRELSSLVLRTLHLDLRLQLLHGITTTLDSRSYTLRQASSDADSSILALSRSLAAADAALSTHLLDPQHNFITSHLDSLANAAFTAFGGTIRDLDVFGTQRLQMNVAVLQQTLKNLQPEAKLKAAERFWELAALGPAAVVERGKDEGFEKSELKALIRLCWEEERDGPAGGVEEFVRRIV